METKCQHTAAHSPDVSLTPRSHLRSRCNALGIQRDDMWHRANLFFILDNHYEYTKGMIFTAIRVCLTRCACSWMWVFIVRVCLCVWVGICLGIQTISLPKNMKKYVCLARESCQTWSLSAPVCICACLCLFYIHAFLSPCKNFSGAVQDKNGIICPQMSVNDLGPCITLLW